MDEQVADEHGREHRPEAPGRVEVNRDATGQSRADPGPGAPAPGRLEEEGQAERPEDGGGGGDTRDARELEVDSQDGRQGAGCQPDSGPEVAQPEPADD